MHLKTDLIAFVAGAIVFPILMHSDIIDEALREIFTRLRSSYKNEEKSVSGLNVGCLEICEELLKNRPQDSTSHPQS